MNKKGDLNQFGQPIGETVKNWHPISIFDPIIIQGSYCELIPLDSKMHSTELFLANSEDDGSMWTYLPYGPFDSLSAYQNWMRSDCTGKDPMFFAIRDLASKKTVGVISFLRIDLVNGVVEIGHLAYSPRLRNSRIGTEAVFLMLQYAFDSGFRRVEWKCDTLNSNSRRAAERLGFSLDGVFLQAAVIKGRNRDTAWYSILNNEWPKIQCIIQLWLLPSNFDITGTQNSRLSVMMAQTKAFSNS